MLWTLDHLPFVTAVAFVLAVLIVLGILVGLTRHYPHEETKAGFGAALVGIVVTVLFSVVLNNLYAMKRDRDSRLRNLRDQHYSQLKSVLRAESSKLTDIADMIAKQAHINRVNGYEGTEIDVSAMLWPDVLSHDLQRHFPDYDQFKHALLSQIEIQDQEFRDTVMIAKQLVKPTARLDPYWREVDAMSYVERCLGRGKGVRLVVQESSYSFEYLGGAVGGSGKPSPDQIAAFRAFESMKANTSATSHCDGLKSRAATIGKSAGELAKLSQLLSESTILTGTCDFLRAHSLSD